MRRPNSRGYLVVASAIVVAGVLISVGFVAEEPDFRTTITSVSTSTSISTTTSVSTSTSVSTTTSVTTPPTSTVTQTQTTTTILSGSQGCSASQVCGSFTYGPQGGAVQVDSVEATEPVAEYGGQANGSLIVQFGFTFVDTSTSPLFFPTGSEGLTVKVGANSSDIKDVSVSKCAEALTIVKLNPGQAYTVYGPSCDSGGEYTYGKPGDASVNFTLSWTTVPGPGPFPTLFANSTSVYAQFVLG